MIHEMGHWLLGGSHPYSGLSKYATWSLLGLNFAGSICMNSFERERLGWINVNEISSSFTTPLSDYVTTGTAYKWHPPNGTTDEWIYFENHQKISIYDDATLSTADNGIWIQHQKGLNGNFKIKPSDGFWDWDNPYSTSVCFAQPLPAFKKTSINRSNSGESHRDKLPLLSSQGERLAACLHRRE